MQRLDQLRHSGSLGLRGSHSRAVSRLLPLHVLPYLSGCRLCVRRLRWFGLLDRPLVRPPFLPVFHRLFFRYAARPRHADRKRGKSNREEESKPSSHAPPSLMLADILLRASPCRRPFKRHWSRLLEKKDCCPSSYRLH